MHKIFFLTRIRMFVITKKNIWKQQHKVMADNNDTLWLNEKRVETGLDHKNVQFITKRYDPKYKKHRCEIEDEPKKQPIRNFLGEDLALVVIMDCITVEARDLKMWLGFKLHDVFNTKEKTAVGQIMKALEGENRPTQSNFLGYRIDLNFHDYKLAIEVDEYGYCDGNADYEIQRQIAIEKELGREFIRINTDESSNSIFKTINETHRKIFYIIQRIFNRQDFQEVIRIRT